MRFDELDARARLYETAHDLRVLTGGGSLLLWLQPRRPEREVQAQDQPLR
jgi:hypothetical protein